MVAHERSAPPRGPLRVLGHRNFAYLWTGSTVSALGSSIGNVVLTWVVFSTTHSPVAVALLGIVGFLPTVVFGLLAGALIDRLDRRRLMVACDAARAVAFGLLIAYTWWFGVSLAAILAAALVVAAFSTVFRPATNAVIPGILPAADVTDGNGLLLAGVTAAVFLGSPVGGLLVVSVGVLGGLAVNAATFGFSGAMIVLMVVPSLARPDGGAGDRAPSLLSEVREGLRYLRSQSALLWATLSGMAANFFLAIYFSFLVIYAGDHLHLAATGFGVLLAANAAGFAVGGLLPGRIGTDRAPGLWYAAAWTSAGLCVAGLGFVGDLGSASALAFGVGILGGLGNTTFLSAVQRTVPPVLLGRYLATDEAGSFAMIPAGQVAGGILILEIGVSTTFVLAGLGAIACSAVLLAMPKVRAWGRPTGSAPSAG